METAIQKVYVVYKTHLDMGFTALAHDVMDQYVKSYIPNAIALANEVNTITKKKFVWTVGSYLLQYFFQNAQPDACAQLVNAIEKGDIEWHRLPFTTHTELMNEAVFIHGLGIAESLDHQFHKHHIAAKLTDVPGHTIAMVPLLASHGILYLHIGINASSRAVSLPELCRLQFCGQEIIVNYANDYGAPCIFKDFALEFAHSADNAGPPNRTELQSEYERIGAKYPHAEIIAASLDDFALALLPYREELPIFRSEIGDTWIHGIASDPYKTSLYCALTDICQQWIQEEPDISSSSIYQEVLQQLLMICEHTWGMDFKKNLYDYQNWSKTSFQQAKKCNQTTKDLIQQAGMCIQTFTDKELTQYYGGQYEGSYSKIEESWQEKRLPLDIAMSLLPSKWQAMAFACADWLKPKVLTPCQGNQRVFVFNKWHALVQQDGTLQLLQTPIGALQQTFLGKLSYETYSYSTVDACYHDYNRDLEQTGEWAEPDFSKPGLQYVEDLEDCVYPFIVSNSQGIGNSLIISLCGNENACLLYGCPKRLAVIYTFTDNSLTMDVQWVSKDESRIPEAIYIRFQMDHYRQLFIEKLGNKINPLDIQPGGSQNMHACRHLTTSDYEFTALHSPLLLLGNSSIYNTKDQKPRIDEGFAYVLYNNRWNTNFPLWYGENAAFRFKIHFKEKT